MGKILEIYLKLNFIRNTLDCYGLTRVSSNREIREIAGILVSTGKNREVTGSFSTNREFYSFFGKQWEFLLKGEKSRKTPTKNLESQPCKIVKIPGKDVKMTGENREITGNFVFRNC